MQTRQVQNSFPCPKRRLPGISRNAPCRPAAKWGEKAKTNKNNNNSSKNGAKQRKSACKASRVMDWLKPISIHHFIFVFFLYFFHHSSCSKDQFTVLILKFGTQDFTDPGQLKIRLTLTGLSLWFCFSPQVFLRGKNASHIEVWANAQCHCLPQKS